MATNTYVALDKVTVSNTTTSSITFTGISGSYTDLQLVISGYTITGSGAFVALRFNSDTASNYSATYLWGNGTTATSGRQTSQTSSTIGAFYSTQANIIANVQNYSNSTTYKTAVARSNSSANNTGAFVSLWRNTAAITSMTVLTTGGEYFNNGATFSLYGIAATSAGAKATGGTVYSDSQYYYHVFGATGTFTPLQSLTCDYLVVAGGGGGGGGYGAGGGAGGLRSTVGTTGGGGSLETALSLSATAYTVTVGAGGAGGSGAGTIGSNSVLSTITSTGGGAGATFSNNGGNGGSGGGAAGRNTFTGGTGTSGQGYAGGNSNYVNNSITAVAGGGGAGAVGGNAVNNGGTSGQSGSGGIGVAISGFSTPTGTGVSSYYAGGGGGASRTVGETTPAGSGGTGGGGAGNPSDANLVATAGTANTGGGGGGSGGTGAAGGSGIVIVRYAK